MLISIKMRGRKEKENEENIIKLFSYCRIGYTK